MTQSRNIVAIIQARMGSRRLPGKVLLDIAGKSMLARVVDRVSQSRLIDRVVVATTDSAADDATAAAAEALGVDVARGSEDDVLDRFHDAAARYAADTIVRVSGDSPFIDPGVCDKAIAAFISARPAVDYASNKLEPSFPLGLDVEVFSRAALERAWSESTQPFERSHVTVYIYRNPGSFTLLPVTTTPDTHFMRWTVDTAEDLEFARRVFDRFGGRNDFSWTDVIALLEREPGLARINSHIMPKDVAEG